MNHADLKKMLSKGHTEKVIERIVAFAQNDSDLSIEAVGLSARFQKYNSDRLGDLVDINTLNLELNKINESALSLIERLNPQQTNSKKKKIIYWFGVIATIITVLGGIAEFSGYSLKDAFKPEIQLQAKPQHTEQPNPNTGGINFDQKAEKIQNNVINGDSITINQN